MTTAQTFESKPQTFENTMLLNGLNHVLGAAGMKSATVSEKRAKQVTINVDQFDEQGFHFVKLF